MLENIASRLTDQLYHHCSLAPAKKAIYKYGFQLSLSTAASMCSIILLGAVLGNISSALLFLGIFFFLRLFTGGYHAPTYARCFLLTNTVYLSVYGLSQGLVYFRLFFFLPVIALVSCVTIILLAPIQNKNHPMSEATYAKNRKAAIGLAILETLLLVILYLWKFLHPYITVPIMSLAAVAVMMLITLKERRVEQ